LLVTGHPDGRVSVSYRQSGEDNPQAYGEPTAFESPLSGQDLSDLSWYLERYLLAPYALYAEKGGAIEGRLSEWGEALFEPLFGRGRPARDAYQQARTRTAELVIHSADPAFLSLPWELLKDPERPTPLALDLRGISRNVSVAGPLIEVPGGDELRVLMVISRPSGLNDVDFQMVARPLHDRLQAVRGKVRLDVTRPPTLKALEARLNGAREAGEPYHVLHFDGHGVFSGRSASPDMFDVPGDAGEGVLLFESDAGEAGVKVPASGFAQVIKRAQVPLVVLNACQSAAMGGEESTTGATVATRLLEEGVRSVVAMSHTVYAVAAAEFMAAFYDALFQGRSVLEATTAGRLQLKRSPDRPSSKGPTPLQDWTVPVLYARSDMSFPALAPQPAARSGPSLEAMLAELRGGAEEAPADRAAVVDGIEAEAGLFVGRGREFYTLELAARTQRVVLIHGPGGTGKTELAKGFARWWRDTGGTEHPALVFFHSFEPGESSFGLDGVLIRIGNRIFQTDLLAKTKSAKERRNLVLKVLRERAMLLVWDNFESVHSMADTSGATPPLDEEGRVEIAGFLRELAKPGGKSAVLITSRNEEAWIGPDGPGLRRLELGGLTSLEAAEYATKLLAGYSKARAKPIQDRAGFEALMGWFDGHPLSVKLVLPHLEKRSAEDLLASLKGQGPLPPGFQGDGRTEGLGACVQYSLDHLAPQARALLSILTLFEGVADIAVLSIFSMQDDAPVPFAGVKVEDWKVTLDRAAALGLLTELGGIYRLHPALPAFLAAQWRREAGPNYAAHANAARNALIVAHAVFGEWLLQEMRGGDAALVFALVAAERRTLGAMASAALAGGLFGPAQSILQALFEYFKARGLTREQRGWVDRCLDAVGMLDDAPPDFDTDAGSLWLLMNGYSGRLALEAHDLAEAEAVYNTIRQSLESAPKSEKQRAHLSTVFHQLGRVTQERGALGDAEVWYRKSLEIKEAIGNRSGMATGYHQLGRIAEERSALDDAEGWYRRSLEIHKTLGDLPSVAVSCHQLGMVDEKRGSLDGAEAWYRKSLEIKQALGDRPGMAASYHQLGTVAQARGSYDDAEAWFRKSLEIYEALRDRPHLASSYGQLGLLADSRGDASAALQWMIRCIALFDTFGHQATGPAPRHLARLSRKYGRDALTAAWQAVIGEAPPAELFGVLERISKGRANNADTC